MQQTETDQVDRIASNAVDEETQRRIEAAQARFSRLTRERTRPRITRCTIGELTYREDFPGFLRLMGYLALLMGLAVGVATMYGVEFKGEGGQPHSPAENVTMAAACLASAGVLLFGRRVRTIDRADSQVTLWWGVLLP